MKEIIVQVLNLYNQLQKNCIKTKQAIIIKLLK